MPLKPEIKALWIDALRSGEYQQGREYLNSEKGFCCLGVLCDLAIKAGVINDWEEGPDLSPHGEEEMIVVKRVAGSASTLPAEVHDWAGFRYGDQFGMLGLVGDGTSLAALNDHGSTFAEIADIIEEKL